MRERKSARLLVINHRQEVLLFRFTHNDGVLAGQDYWATPGGGLEPGESFEAAAVRELYEETGICAATVGEAVSHRSFPLRLNDGEWVTALEQYFVVRVNDPPVSKTHWTEEEKKVVADYRWWSQEALRSTSDIVWPETLSALLRELE